MVSDEVIWVCGMQAVDDVLGFGSEEHSEYSSMTSTWKTDDLLLHEGRTAYRLTRKVPACGLPYPRGLSELNPESCKKRAHASISMRNHPWNSL